jgi:hypothetical protein
VYIQQPAPPPVYIQVAPNKDDSPIYLFDTKEYFTEDEKALTSISRAFNMVYRGCYKGFFLFILFISALAIPFIGMFAGAHDAVLAIYARPFARPIGKLIAETTGFYKGNYFTYMENDKKKESV